MAHQECLTCDLPENDLAHCCSGRWQIRIVRADGWAPEGIKNVCAVCQYNPCNITSMYCSLAALLNMALEATDGGFTPTGIIKLRCNGFELDRRKVAQRSEDGT